MRVGMIDIEKDSIYTMREPNDVGPMGVTYSPELVTHLQPAPPAPPPGPEQNTATIETPHPVSVQRLGVILAGAALVVLAIGNKKKMGAVGKGIWPVVIVGGLGYLYFQSQKNKTQ